MMCVECGEDVQHLIKGACADCFTSNTDLMMLQDVLTVEFCAHCGARRIGAHWHERQEGVPDEWVIEEAVEAAAGVHKLVEGAVLDIGLAPQDDHSFNVSVRLHGRVDDAPVEVVKTCLVRRVRATCDRCSRVHGGFYAAIIQLRATERDVTEKELEKAHKIVQTELERSHASGNRFAFLAKDGPMHGGYDYYVGDIDAGRNVSRRLKERLGATVQESAKLVGRREGEDVYRVTFLVRIGPFTAGDIILHDKRLCQVTAVHDKRLAVFDLERLHKNRVMTDAAKRLGGPEVIEHAVVVSSEQSGTLVLDPKTQETVTVLVPEGEAVGDTMDVYRHDGRLYWVHQTNNP